MPVKKTTKKAPAKKTAKASISKSTANKTIKKVEAELKVAEKKAVNAAKSFAKNAPKLAEKAQKYTFSKALKDIKKLWVEGIQLIISPKQYFGNIKATGDYSDSIVKALAYGLIGAGISVLFALLGGEGLGSLFRLIFIPLGAVFLTFSLGGILSLMSYICGGKVDFEIAVKAVASKIFLYPIVILINTFAINYYILAGVSFLVDSFVLYLVYSAVMHCFSPKPHTTRVVFGIFGALLVLMYLSDSSMLWLSLKNQTIVAQHYLSSLLGNDVDMEALRNLFN